MIKILKEKNETMTKIELEISENMYLNIYFAGNDDV